MNVSVENDADEFVRLVDHWTAAVTAYDVRVGNEIKLCCEIQLRLALDPALGEIEGRAVIVFGSALIESSEIRKRRNLFSIFLVTHDFSVGQAERESRVRIITRPFNCETRFRDFGIGLPLNFLLRLMRLACFPSRRVDHSCEIEQRIVRRLQRRRVFRVKIFSKLDIFQFCSADQFHRACVRRFAGEDLSHQRIVASEFLGEIGE